MKESKDDKVRIADVQARKGRNWSASKSVSEAESKLKYTDIVETVAAERQGLSTSKIYSRKTMKPKRDKSSSKRDQYYRGTKQTSKDSRIGKQRCLVEMRIRTTISYMVKYMVIISVPTTVYSKISV